MKERLEADLKSALKNGQTEVVSVLRFLLAQIQAEEIKKRGQAEEPLLSDDVITALLKTEVKRRVEAVEMFRNGNRNDLVEQEEKALVIIRQYLPEELSREQIEALVKKHQAEGQNDFNSLIKAVMAEAKGQADGKQVSEVVKQALNG